MKPFDIVLNPRTEAFISAFVEKPRQSILFVGEKGFGKSYIVNYILNLFSARKEDIHTVLPNESSAISVDEIRKLKSFLKLKTNDVKTKRFILINNADAMTEEAQNALLKMLEEPPENCIFLMSTSNKSKLLETILSRVDVHELSKPSIPQLSEYIVNHGGKEAELKRIIAVSNGLPALAICISSGKDTEYMSQIDSAKSFLTGSVENRLRQIEVVLKDKQKTIEFLDALMVIVKASINNQISTGNLVGKWESRARLVMKTQILIKANVSTKLALTDLSISL